jgi:hypothetical protein
MGNAKENFIATVLPRFYRQVMEGVEEVPEMSFDSRVGDIFDVTSRAEFFDWLGTELATEIPCFSFSLVKTFSEFYDLLATLVGEEFVKYCTLSCASTAPAVKPDHIGKDEATKSEPTISVVTANVDDSDSEHMPHLEPVSNDILQSAKEVISEKEGKIIIKEIAKEVSAVQTDEESDFLKGRAICFVLAMSRSSTVEVATQTVLGWNDQLLRGFLAGCEEGIHRVE